MALKFCGLCCRYYKRNETHTCYGVNAIQKKRLEQELALLKKELSELKEELENGSNNRSHICNSSRNIK